MQRPAGAGVLLFAALASAGCSAAFWQGFSEGLANSTNPSAAAGGASAYGATKLMIFGGEGHKTYLGCLNCSQYAADSLLNRYSEYGSAYSATSIFNNYGEFGSRYSSYSACNPYATDPPVIVDGEGNFYGRLTVNAYNPQATRNERTRAWIAGVCADR